MTERVQKAWLRASAAYVVVVLALSVGTVVSDSYGVVVARLLVCAPFSLIVGPFEVLFLYAVSAWLGSGTAIAAVAAALDVLGWGMLAALQAYVAYAMVSLVRARLRTS
ncbi:hypothetical protein KOI35_14990 [Actinoplanes bogorensis]|uniref:Uncharacterized protein n=1 Tax=Paractinoplanes bogorensis TaxID=1610840 RepID=A0ABS5YP27_9ACTN|nr:hypothetical protein [Actinoplanes bogorensis]MBU2664806.1 hypothetical protein [Actinoplanes bogorensis]